jgi:hypothetical protein
MFVVMMLTHPAVLRIHCWRVKPLACEAVMAYHFPIFSFVTTCAFIAYALSHMPLL